MKRLFIYLLKKYSKSEKNRIEIYKELFESTTSDYSEQTTPGNIYNAGIEFLTPIPIKDKDILISLLTSSIRDL